jgi:hypothetical protein
MPQNASDVLHQRRFTKQHNSLDMAKTKYHLYSELSIVVILLCSFSAAAQSKSIPNTSQGVVERLGYPNNARLLLIQGEDLGMAHSVNKATLEALERGWITTANVLVPGPWFPEVVRWSRSHPNADLGVELDLNSDWNSMCWRPVSNQSAEGGLVDQFGWLPASDRYVARRATAEAVLKEVRAQMEIARRTGLPLSHLDHHMHVMLLSPVLFRAYWQMGQDYTCRSCCRMNR